MIIYADGWDDKTAGYSTMVINTKDILYARGRDSRGNTTIVYLRHNVTKGTDNETRANPIWVVLNMPIKDFYEKWKEAEEKNDKLS